MKKLLRSLSRYVSSRKVITRRGPVFLYHHVGYEKPGNNANIHNVTEETFRLQIHRISNEFEIVFVDELLRDLESGKDVQGRAAITFDDGTSSAVQKGIPILNEMKVPATFFLNSSLVDGGRFWRDYVNAIIDNGLEKEFVSFGGSVTRNITVKRFYWDTKDVRLVSPTDLLPILRGFANAKGLLNEELNMHADIDDLIGIDSPYIQFGNHSRNHFILAALPYSEQLAEIRDTKNLLHQHFANERISEVFSIPFGNQGTYNSNTAAALKAIGYRFALGSESNKYFDKDEPTYTDFDSILIYNRFMPKENSTLCF